MKKFFENKPRAWFVIGSVFVIVLTVLASLIILQESTIRVGDEKITEKDINRALYSLDFQGTPENPEGGDNKGRREMVVDGLIKSSIIRQEATKRKIVVTDKETLERSKVQVPDYDNRIELQQTLIKEASASYLSEEKIKETIIGYAEGEYLFIRFEIFYNEGDDKYLEAKESAKELADELYSKLQSGEITFDDAQKKVEAHPTFGKEAFESKNFKALITGGFNKGVYENGIGAIGDSQFRGLIDNIKAGSVSAPSLLQVDHETDSEEIKKIDGIYTIVKVDKYQGGESNSFEEWLSIKKTEYIKPTLLENLLGLFKIPYAKAYVNWSGTCAGGLSTGSTTSGAGLFLQYYYTSGVGTFYALPSIPDYNQWTAVGGGNVVIDSTSTNAFTWKGVGTNCDAAAVTWQDAATNTGHMSAAWVPGTAYLGYVNPNCGGSPGLILHCSCANKYYASFGFGDWNGFTTENTALEQVDYYHPSGDITSVDWNPAAADHTYLRQASSTYGTTYYYENPNINPFYFNDIANGYTAGMNIFFRENRPPSVVPTAPTRDQVFSLDSAEVRLNARASDPDGDTVNTLVAWAKSTDNGVTYGPWNYAETGLAVPDNRTIKAFVPTSALGVGKYKWVVAVRDEHGKFNANPPGSSNMYNHGDPWYFSIISSKTITYNGNGNNGGSVPSGNPYSVASGGSHTVQGNTGSLTKTSYTFSGWNNTLSNGTVTSYSAGNTITNVTSDITLDARWIPSNVSCSVTPERGLSPLVVKVEFSNGVPPYNLTMESGVTLIGRSTPVYYTYGSAGTKNITVSDSDSITGNCVVSVVVTDPSEDTGGEVAP